MRVVFFSAVVAITLGACADQEQALVGPTGRTFPERISAAKPVPNPPARFEYETVAQSLRGGRLIGDQRNASGGLSLDTSIYEDGTCGVTAQIFVGGSGDATMDPIGSSSTCQPRALKVEFGTPIAGDSVFGTVTGAYFTNVRDVHSLAPNEEPGDSGERRFRLLFRNFAGCDYLRYENPDGSDGRPGTADDVTYGVISGKSIRVTRLADDNGKRVWLAESQPTGTAHVAFCEKVGRRGSTYVGAYDIPFRVFVKEK